MRILHTSDWHLGRQFHNVSLLEDQRHVLAQLVAIVEREKVDVVLVAGDVYDRSVPPADAVQLLNEVLDDLVDRLGVPVLLIAGNHDGPERMAFGARQLAASGLHIVGPLRQQPEPVVLADAHGEVAFYALPYAEPARVREVLGADVHTHEEALAALLAQVRADNPAGRRCVVVAHCFLEGGAESESERPLSVGGADRVSPELFTGFDYVALGHLHAPQHRGEAHVRYSGSLLKYSFSEVDQRKGVTLVEMGADGRCDWRHLTLAPRRDMRILAGDLQEIIASAGGDPAADDYLLVRLQDTHAILDVMSKLRAVYPNVLHLERPGLALAGERRAVSRDQLERGLMPLFRDFWQQMTGQELEREAAALVAELVQDIQSGEAQA